MKWGLPSEGFDIHSALLLADTEDEEDLTEYVTAGMVPALPEVWIPWPGHVECLIG